METLLAVSTLAIGLIFVGGAFLTGIYLATVSTERTIATVAADEALAKIRLYNLDPAAVDANEFTPHEELVDIPDSEFLYPSDPNSASQYSWAALCKRMGAESRLVQIVVFVSRQAGTNARYWTRSSGTGAPDLEQGALPRPLRIKIGRDAGAADDELTIEDDDTSDDADESKFVNGGATIVDDATGQIYRVLERYTDPPDRIRLDRPWAGPALTAPADGDDDEADPVEVWVVPQPATGGRSPFVAVYQEVLRF